MLQRRWLVTLALCAVGARPALAGDPAEPQSGGFRLTPRPKIIDVYGDTTAFRAHIDRFFTLTAEMEGTRIRFSRDVQLVLATLAAGQAAGGRRKCPTDAVAAPVARAFALGEAYQTQGRELEGHHYQIENLFALGEGTGLTPDYRWKVLEARRQYPALVRDWREMRTAFSRELTAELEYAGCTDLPALIAKGDALSGGNAAPADVIMPVAQPKLRVNPRDVPPVPATAPVVTFAVDNVACPAPVALVVDDEALGQVAGGARLAFRTAAGRHTLCLLASREQKCGDPGTRRTAYIHEGWAITLRCD